MLGKVPQPGWSGLPLYPPCPWRPEFKLLGCAHSRVKAGVSEGAAGQERGAVPELQGQREEPRAGRAQGLRVGIAAELGLERRRVLLAGTEERRPSFKEA